MKQLRRIGATLAVLAVVFGCLAGVRIIHPAKVAHAQQFGASVPIGFFAQATNGFGPTLTAGQAGTVTNPAVNFLMQIDGGPVFCLGANEFISESNITLAPNTTFLIVYSCPQNLVYAKTAVTAPGTPTPNQPGVPATLLFPGPGEVSLATVVCSATACGNGSGSITDSRPASSFPTGAIQVGSVTFANLPTSGVPNGSVIYCSNCTLPAAPATCTGASTGSLAMRINGAWVCP